MLVSFAAVALIPFAVQSPTARAVTVSSPDGRTRAEVNAADGMLRYRIVVDGKQVLAPSMIGIEADDVELGRNVTLGSAKLRKIDEHTVSLERMQRQSIAPGRQRSRHNPTASRTSSKCVWPTMASAFGCGYQLSQDEGYRPTGLPG